MEVHKAVKKGTNIFAASQILGVSMHAFQYIQFSEIPFGTLDLNLDEFNYEVQFHRVVQSKIDGKQEDYDGCLALIGIPGHSLTFCIHDIIFKRSGSIKHLTLRLCVKCMVM